MTRNGVDTEVRFWLKWVIGNALGSGFGLFIALHGAMVFYVLGFMISRPGRHTAIEALFLPAALGILFAVYGFFLGLGQWVILNLRAPTPRYWFWLSCLGWAVVGGTLGYLWSVDIYPESSAIVAAIVFGGSCGFVVGTSQWLILRRMTTSAGWWLGISAIGYAIGYALPAWISLRETIVGDISLFLYIGLGQIIAGAIMGLGLIWILEPSNSSQSGVA